MKVGDLVMRTVFMNENHIYGIIMLFDKDGDPIIYWSTGFLEEEYASQVEVISEIELSDAQLEHVCGGMNPTQFDIWRCGIINEDR